MGEKFRISNGGDTRHGRQVGTGVELDPCGNAGGFVSLDSNGTFAENASEVLCYPLWPGAAERCGGRRPRGNRGVRMQKDGNSNIIDLAEKPGERR